MRAVIVVAMVVTMFPFTVFADETFDLRLDLTAHGNRVALKLDDETCQFGFPGLIDDPDLVILDEEGEELIREPLGEGDWSMRDKIAYCTQSYTLTVPRSGRYTIQIPPYFTQDYSAEELQDGTLKLELTREEGDPFPLPVRPEGGRIEGTDEYRLVGTLELRGEGDDEFMILLGCYGLGGYDDIQPGARITIADQSGESIAVTELEADPLAEGSDECRFQFVAEVPKATFYTLSMGRRGDMTFSFEELEDEEWFIELSIG